MFEQFPIRMNLRTHARALAPLATLFALVIFFSIFTSGFFDLYTLNSVLKQASTRALVATGLTFVLLCCEIDLSVALVATLAGCQMGVLYKWMLDTGPAILSVTGPDGSITVTLVGAVLALLLPVLTGVLIGVINGLLTVWSRLPSFIITLAMMEIARGLASYLTKGAQYPDMPGVLPASANEGILIGADFELPYSVFVVGTIMLAAHFVLIYTRFGRYVYMTGGNREAARLAGVRTGFVVVGCLAICGMTASLGGLMNAGWINSAGINQNLNLLLEAIACVVLGGTSLFGGEGGIKNTLIGVLAFTVLDVGLGYVTWVDEFLRRSVMGLVLLSALLLNGQLAKIRQN